MPAPGNTLASALNLLPQGLGTDTFTDVLSDSNPFDYYRFNLSGRSGLALALTDLTGNVDLQLLSQTGTVLEQSSNLAMLSERIDLLTNAGTYYVRVGLGAGDRTANYRLTVQAQSQPTTDILWRNYANGQNTVWQMEGTAFGGAVPIAGSPDPNWQMQGAGDFNGDGKSDILWRNVSTGHNTAWLMDGTGLITGVALEGASDLNWRIGGAGDFDGDGKLDILWRNGATGQNTVWLMNGTTFRGAVPLLESTDLNWQIGGVGDFDGDSKVDILWRNGALGKNTVWFMDRTTFRGAVPLIDVADLNWQMRGAGDFDGDGKVDILWRNGSTEKTTVWLMNGTVFRTAVPLVDVASSWQPLAPFTRFKEPTRVDGAGNTGATAFQLGVLNGSGSYRDQVSGGDEDYYTFTLNQRRLVELVVERTAGNGTVSLTGFASVGGGTPVRQVLEAGTYTFKVSQLEGGVSDYRLLVRAQPIAPTLRVIADTGRSDSDGMTQDGRVGGVTEPGARVKLYRVGTEDLLGQTTADLTGSWRVSLADGLYELVAIATDAWGRTSERSGTLRVAIDSQAPQIPMLDWEGELFNGQQNYEIYGETDPNAFVKIFRNGQFLAQVEASNQGLWDFDVTGFATGTHEFTITATDIAGNESLRSAVLKVINAVPTTPMVPTGLNLVVASDSGLVGDRVTKISTPIITGQAPASTPVTLFVDGVEQGSTTADPNGTWSIPVTEDLSNTEHTFTAITSQGGLTSPFSAPLVVRIDGVQPSLNLTVPGTIAPWTRLTGTVTDAGSPPVTLSYTIQGSGGQAAPSRPVVVDATGRFSQLVDLSGVTPGAGQTLILTGTDQAGNVLTRSFPISVVTSTAGASQVLPEVSAGLLRDTAPKQGTNADGYTSDPTIRTVVSSPNRITKVEAGFTTGGTTGLLELPMLPDANGEITLGLEMLEALFGSPLTDGAYSVTLRVTDEFSNVVSSTPVAFRLDATAPEFSVTDLLEGVRWKPGQQRLKGEVDTAEGVSLFYQLDGGTERLVSLAGKQFDQVLPLSELNFGAHTLRVTARDQAGNEQVGEFSFLLKQDGTPVDTDPDSRPPVTNPPQPNDRGVQSYPNLGGGSFTGRFGGSSGGGSGGGSLGWMYTYPGSSGTWNPNDNYWNPTAPTNGDDELLSYRQRIQVILEQADLILPTSARRAALRNRQGQLLDAASLVEAGQFYEELDLSLYGIYFIASEIRTRGQAKNVGAYLAGQLSTYFDASDPAVKVQVVQTTALTAVNEVLRLRGGSLDLVQQPDQYTQLLQAVTGLGALYAQFDPILPAVEDRTTPDFLQKLWRGQLTGTNGAIQDLQTLLVGVATDKLAQTIQFIHNLLRAANEVEVLSQGDDLRNPLFLRELVEFGVEFAKLNPNTTLSSEPQGFLDVLWRLPIGQSPQIERQLQQGAAGLNQLFEEVESNDERLEMLTVGQHLLQAARELSAPELQAQKRNPQFVGALVELLGTYTSLAPELAVGTANPMFFLNTLRESQDVEKGRQELEGFLQDVTDPIRLLKLESNLMRAANQVQERSQNVGLTQQLHDAGFIEQLFELGKAYADSTFSAQTGRTDTTDKSFLRQLSEGRNSQDVQRAADDFELFFEDFDTTAKRAKLVEYETRLLQVEQQVPGVEGLHDVEIVDALLSLGRVYAALEPSLDDDLDTFLEAVFFDGSSQAFAESTEKLEQFFNAELETDDDNQVSQRTKSLEREKKIKSFIAEAIKLKLPTGINSYWIPSTATLYELEDYSRKALFQTLLDPSRGIKTFYLDILATGGATVHKNGQANRNTNNHIFNILENDGISDFADDTVREFYTALNNAEAATKINRSNIRLSAWIQGSAYTRTRNTKARADDNGRGTTRLERREGTELYSRAVMTDGVYPKKQITGKDVGEVDYIDLVSRGNNISGNENSAFSLLKEFILEVANRKVGITGEQRPAVNDIILDDNFGIPLKLKPDADGKLVPDVDYLDLAIKKYLDPTKESRQALIRQNLGYPSNRALTQQDVIRWLRDGLTLRLREIKGELDGINLNRTNDQKVTLSVSVQPFDFENDDLSISNLADRYTEQIGRGGWDDAMKVNLQDVASWFDQGLITGTLNVQIYRFSRPDFQRTYDNWRLAMEKRLRQDINDSEFLSSLPKFSVSIAVEEGGSKNSLEDIEWQANYVLTNPIQVSPGDRFNVSVVGFDALDFNPKLKNLSYSTR